ncbi:MAG TPA: FAD-binding protein [Gaiellaceae bacterium]|nr:FAD-binding protein [Gaiellaceae bacterium]
MKIVVLVKQVPNPSHVRLDPETKRLVREGVPLELNEFDVYALTEAIRLRDAHGGEVVAMTMGPPQAEEALRTALAMGVDRAVHLNDKVFAVADTIGTSRTLALAVAKEGADLVLCGRKTVDSETWQVPPETAAFLGWEQLTGVDRLELAGDRLRGRRETDEGFDTYELGLPALVSVTDGINEGLWPAKRDVEATATDGRITTWTAADLVDDVEEDDKRFGQSGSPTRVLAVKDVTPERRGEIAPDPEQAAARILELLAETDGPSASAWEKPDRLGEKPGRSYDCWTVVELVEGASRRVSLELLGKGRELAGKLGGENVALILGRDLEGPAREAVRHGAERVVLVDDERLAEYHPETFAAALRRVVESERPHVLLIPSTAQGRDYGPRVAGELELGMTGDCVDLGIDRAGRLIQYKPAYGGNIVSVIMGATTPQLATVRPGMFAPVEPRNDVAAEVGELEVGLLPEPSTRLVGREQSPETAGYELDAAAVCLCAGKGVGGPEAIPELEAYAARLGGALGGSRDVTDAGWIPKNRQIGLTGRAIAPRLLVEVGVRGAFEHTVGSVRAGVIAALNANERAPIFAHADVGVVGDWRETLPPLVEALEGRLP